MVQRGKGAPWQTVEAWDWWITVQGKNEGWFNGLWLRLQPGTGHGGVAATQSLHRQAVWLGWEEWGGHTSHEYGGPLGGSLLYLHLGCPWPPQYWLQAFLVHARHLLPKRELHFLH